ncbi:MAG: hypothetical protein K8R89_06955 [Anaerolineae bacterium]|nr:hypothetical protein [Anaerolineae bacterium]
MFTHIIEKAKQKATALEENLQIVDRQLRPVIVVFNIPGTDQTSEVYCDSNPKEIYRKYDVPSQYSGAVFTPEARRAPGFLFFLRVLCVSGVSITVTPCFPLLIEKIQYDIGCY